MAEWKCKRCGRTIICSVKVELCNGCRTNPPKKKRPVESPSNKMVDIDEVKTK